MTTSILVDRYSARDPPPVNIDNCSREQIHIPGAIQPHGMLFALEGCDLRITSVSANTSDHLGHEPQSLLNVPMAHMLDEQSLLAVSAAVNQPNGSPGRLIRLHLNGASNVSWRALVHATPSGVLLEVKLPRPHQELAVNDLFERFDQGTRRLRGASDVHMICSRLAAEVRNLTGYGRVKVYRFARDWSGEVIAEDKADDMPSYLGLHFPAEDIPVQARELYVRNPERQIPDVNYVAVPLVTANRIPIDLSQAVLRSVSPIHIEYLRNMGVGASMSISILRRGELWGLIACHDRACHYVAPELRQASLLLAQLAAWQLTVTEETEVVRRSGRVKAVETVLLREASGVQGHMGALLNNGAELLDLLEASGFAVSHGGSVVTMGETPSSEALSGVIGWLASRSPNVFETDHLEAHYPAAAELHDAAAGIIAVPLGGASDNLMVWFRPEIARSVTWSGAPGKTEISHPRTGESRLSPRRSFEAWTEDVRGRSRSWEPHDVMAAKDIGDVIVDILLRRSADLERMNTRLVSSNEELEAFANVASHDLREPLRQIETFGALLERAFVDRSARAADAARWFEGIQASSKRLRILIRDLAEYSRLGRQAKPHAPTRLDQLLQGVREDLGRQIEESGAVLEFATGLPTVMCDRTQLHQVLQNVISNALKYRHPDRPAVIRVAATVRQASDAALPILEITIADNGIGIAERYWEKIFEPFQRLHSADDYEGTGIGLAICRKIMDRHRGMINVISVGQGSTFKITLPLQSITPTGPPS